MKTTKPIAASYEIVFDNGGGATLQKHDGSVAIPYSDMDKLAADIKALDGGDDPVVWDGSDPSIFVSDEDYERHASNGGLYALQLDPEYRHNWPDAEETGRNNVASFVRAMA